MVMGLPLVVPTDPAAIQQFRHTFKEMSISSDLRKCGTSIYYPC